MLVEKWLEQMEKFLKMLGVEDDATSIKLVSFQLRDSTETWWKSIRDSRDIPGMTLGLFKELFLECHFQAVVQDRNVNPQNL